MILWPFRNRCGKATFTRFRVLRLIFFRRREAPTTKLKWQNYSKMILHQKTISWDFCQNWPKNLEVATRNVISKQIYRILKSVSDVPNSSPFPYSQSHRELWNTVFRYWILNRTHFWYRTHMFRIYFLPKFSFVSEIYSV